MTRDTRCCDSDIEFVLVFQIFIFAILQFPISTLNDAFIAGFIAHSFGYYHNIVTVACKISMKTFHGRITNCADE